MPPAPSGARAAAGPLDLIDLFALSYRAPRAALPAAARPAHVQFYFGAPGRDRPRRPAQRCKAVPPLAIP